MASSVISTGSQASRLSAARRRHPDQLSEERSGWSASLKDQDEAGYNREESTNTNLTSELQEFLRDLHDFLRWTLPMIGPKIKPVQRPFYRPSASHEFDDALHKLTRTLEVPSLSIYQADKSESASGAPKADDIVRKSVGPHYADTLRSVSNRSVVDLPTLVFTRTSERPKFRHTSRARAIDLKNVYTDPELFHALRAELLKTLGDKLLAWTGLRRVVGIKFAKYQFNSMSQTTRVEYNELPPIERTEYEYFPRPATTIPPVGSALLTHYFHVPGDILEGSLILSRLPKLRYGTLSDSDTAWGIEIDDTFSPHRTLYRIVFCGYIASWCAIPLMSWVIWKWRLTFRSSSIPFFLAHILTMQLPAIFYFLIMIKWLPYPSSVAGPVQNTAHSDQIHEAANILHSSRNQHNEILQLVLTSLVPQLRRAFARFENVLDSLGRTMTAMSTRWNRQDGANLFKISRCNSCHRDLYVSHSSHHEFVYKTSSSETDLEKHAQEALEGSRLDSSRLVPRPMEQDIEMQANGRSHDQTIDQVSQNSSSNPSHGPPTGSDGSSEENDLDGGDGEGSNRNGSGNSGGGGGGGNREGDTEESEPAIELATPGQWVHMILQETRGPKSQTAVDISLLPDNHTAFGGLGTIFRQSRGSWRASTSVKNVRLTKYELHSSSGRAVTQYDPKDLKSMMPPPTDLNFEYTHRGVRTDPLIPDCILYHMFSHPTAIIEEYEGKEYRNRLPKRKSRLEYTIGEAFPVGWGLEWEEGFNWQFFYHSEMLVCAFTILFVVLWIGLSKEQDKVATAFTAGSFLLGAGQVGYLFAIAISERLEFWRY